MLCDICKVCTSKLEQLVILEAFMVLQNGR